MKKDRTEEGKGNGRETGGKGIGKPNIKEEYKEERRRNKMEK